MPRPCSTLIRFALASFALACAQPETDAAALDHPSIVPGTMADIGAAARAADSAARAAESAARALPADSAAATPDSTPIASGEDQQEHGRLRRPDPALGALAVIPAVYADSAECPGAGCGFRNFDWTVTSSIPLFGRPDTASRVIATVESNTAVTLIAWIGFTVPQPFVVHRAVSVEGRQGEHAVRGEHVPGDTLWVLDHSSEGYFRVRLANTAVVDDYPLEFAPGGGSYGKRCESHPDCWGVLASELKEVNWVKLRAPDGREGWTKAWNALVIPD